jgi:peptidyl-prolyl cis-trans isomerase D
MAIVNKIREKSGIAVVVIAIALILFIVGGDFISGAQGSGLFGGNNNKVGEINGTSVDFQQFASQVEAQRMQYEGSTGRSATEQELAQIREQVWEKLIFENVYTKEFERVGITVSDDELREMVQGPKNIHPFVKQQFSDQAGNFDAATHAQFIQSYANNTMPAQQRTMWDGFKRELRDVRMREKYANLLNSSSYITKAEAKAEYVNNTEKASGKYLYVPFYSIADSTIKVSDGDINSYYSKHKEEFNPYDSRSLTYITFSLLPTKEDSVALMNDLRQLAKGLATAVDPVAYASEQSDVRTAGVRAANELSPELKSVLSTSIEGAIVGPFKEGTAYAIHKYLGTENDAFSTVRASHILFRADTTMTQEQRDQAKKQALEILGQAKSGVDFSILARQYGTDGTAQSGGDLGSFQNNGGMVKPFEDAVFAFSGTGILPNLVTTDFGYHIVKVTEPKSNLKYKLASITKELHVGDEGSNEIFQKASQLISSAKTVKDLEEIAKKDDSIDIFTATNIQPGSSSVNTLRNAKSVVQWAYGNEAKVGKVADQVFELDDNYIVAALTAASDKNAPKAADFKDLISAKIRNEKKAEIIAKKLGDAKGDFNAIAAKYGAGALVEEVADISLQTGMLNSAGFDPVAVGKLFGLKAGSRSKVFTGDSGVFIMENTAKVAAPQIADYSQFKTQIQQRSFGMGGMIGEEILRANAKIEDNRAKMF